MRCSTKLTQTQCMQRNPFKSSYEQVQESEEIGVFWSESEEEEEKSSSMAGSIYNRVSYCVIRADGWCCYSGIYCECNRRKTRGFLRHRKRLK